MSIRSLPYKTVKLIKYLGAIPIFTKWWNVKDFGIFIFNVIIYVTSYLYMYLSNLHLLDLSFKFVTMMIINGLNFMVVLILTICNGIIFAEITELKDKSLKGPRKPWLMVIMMLISLGFMSAQILPTLAGGGYFYSVLVAATLGQLLLATLGNLFIINVVITNFIESTNNAMDSMNSLQIAKVEYLLDGYKKLQATMGFPLFLVFTAHTVSGILHTYFLMTHEKNWTFILVIGPYPLLEYLTLVMLAMLAEDCFQHVKDNLAKYW